MSYLLWNILNKLYPIYFTTALTNIFCLQDHGKLVEPQEIKIENKKLGYIVPFKKKLEVLLSLPENKILNKHNEILKCKKINSEICEGEYIQKQIKQKQEINSNKPNIQKDILLFAFYYDDIEVVNAIGASRKKHKLGILN